VSELDVSVTCEGAGASEHEVSIERCEHARSARVAWYEARSR
jgi:hypothetical protein